MNQNIPEVIRFIKENNIENLNIALNNFADPNIEYNGKVVLRYDIEQ
jgi:hypothetical protein